MPSQVPHGRHSWESTIRRSGHTTSFGAAAHPHDTSANGSYELYKPENAAIYSNLVRRSRSLTDADMASIDAGLQPPGRRRSFFSPRKPKAAPDPSPNQSSLTPTPRSLSGLLPSHLGREDSGSLLDSDRDGAKSFTSKDNRVVDTDSTAGNAKSAKWWSWGGSRAPLKPDAKLMPAACQNSVGLDSLPHSVFAGDLVKQQQTASASPQDGYADLLAGLGSNNSQGIADGPASTSNTSEQSQRQAGSHSRRVSWDDSILDGPNAPALAHKSDAIPRSDAGVQSGFQPSNSLSQRLDSLELPDNFAAVPASTSYIPTTTAAPSAVATSAASNASATAAPAAPSLAEVDSPSTSAPPVTDGEKKKGHRRGRSLTGLIPTLKTKPKRSVSELLPAEPIAPAAASSQARPKTPDSKAASSNSSLVQCFGMGRTLDDAAEKEVAPSGVVGLRNLGNTCFVNVALQCLRYTPQLATSIIPDLMTLSPLPEESSLPNSSQALPRISLQQSIAQRSHEFQTGSLHHAHASAQTPATDAVATPQHASPAQEQSNHSHLTSHDQSQVQHAGGQSAAQFQTGAAANLAQIPEVVSVTAPSQQFDEGKQYSSQASGLSAQAAQAAAVSDGSISAQQQAGSNESQAAGVQQQPATAPAGADNLAAAAPSQSTADKQPPPVVPARVPLKKGEIADSFRALVREVYSIGGHNSRKEAVDPAQFLRRISQLPAGAEFCDGGQHDGHELLRLLLHSLHDDLNRITKKPAYEEDKDIPGEAEGDKANRFWRKYLQRDNSPITDLFGGQLQSTVHCHKCKGNFTTYEPFWDLSLPIAKEGKTGISAWLSGKTVPTTIQDCLQAFTGDEVLQGDESFKCEVCAEKTEATKRMRLHRLPKVLLLHVKRFKYSGSSREKLTANVSFPTKALKLNQFVSADISPADSNASYDLYAVSNHFGSMAGGHYTAACRVGLPDGREQWYNFNDSAVAKLSPAGVVSACAYILFYVRAD